VPAGKLREVALMLKAIHAQEDLPAAQRKAAEVIARLHSMRLGKAAELVETAVPETLAYYAFPEEHWRRIRTNNPLERIMREIRRRTRVVGPSPTATRPSIWPPPGSGTSPARAGRPNGI
jgi:Transposase and inactivated derivatives